nr:hypothetical protein [Fimbriimonadaceae bacterium]
MTPRIWIFLALLLGLVACSTEKKPESSVKPGQPQTASDLREALGASLTKEPSDEWKANRIAEIDPPLLEGDLGAALEEPFSITAPWSRPGSTQLRKELISALLPMAGKLEAYAKVTPPAPETVSTRFQAALSAYLLLARLELVEGRAASGVARILKAHQWATDAIATAPGSIAASEVAAGYLMVMEVAAIDSRLIPPAEIQKLQEAFASVDLRT